MAFLGKEIQVMLGLIMSPQEARVLFRSTNEKGAGLAAAPSVNW
jgi:hypothetical protein